MIVADDKKAANTLIAGTLQLQGFEVFSVPNTLEALNKIDTMKGEIDAIYMEGNITKERSAMIIPRIRQINPKIKILVIVDDQQTKEEVEKLKPDFTGIQPTSVQSITDKLMALIIRPQIGKCVDYHKTRRNSLESNDDLAKLACIR